MKIERNDDGTPSGRMTRIVFVGGLMHGHVAEVDTSSTQVTVQFDMRPGQLAVDHAPELADARCVMMSTYRRRIFEVRLACASVMLDTVVWTKVDDEALPGLLSSAFVAQCSRDDLRIGELGLGGPGATERGACCE